ncbi:MAG: class A beta-lactamase-related serine hydrolase [Sphingobacteriia bacterium]|nr:MAG: class A beta-lactamase-related serine hydrolase [Sphingobacteriia bacterium]TAH08220.1 MAG: class A beta-lactamase-related serine hydrolase [Sphingobacteriia bacterium]
MKKGISIVSMICTMFFSGNAQSVLIQKKIDSIVASKSIEGIIIGTLNKGEKTYYTAGLANAEKQLKFEANTQLEIGSITKTMTAYILESVLKEMKLSDTAFIINFLPDSVQSNKALGAIRFIHLLNHTAGFPRLPPNSGEPLNALQPYENYTLNKLYSYLLVAKPNAIGKVDYSNFGVGLAGHLATIISGKPYDQLLKKYVTTQFKLTNTAMIVNNKLPISTGYYKKQLAEYWNMAVLEGAGGVKSTAADMLQYVHYMLQHQESTSIKDLITKTNTINQQLSIAKCWHIFISPNNAPIIWHNGGTYGFSTFIAFNQTTNQAVFVAINSFNKNGISDRLGIEILTKILPNNE